MRWAPTWATTLGDHRRDDQLAPRDAAAMARLEAERGALLARLAGLAGGPLDELDRVTHAQLTARLAGEHGLDRCRFHEWLVESGGGSVFGELSYVALAHTVAVPGDAANLVARMAQGVAAIDDTIANLARGLAAGRVSGAEKLRRAIRQLDGELRAPVATWAMATPAWAAAPDPDPWPPGARDRAVAALRDVVTTELAPAFVRLRDFLRDRVLPAARGEVEGLAGLPGGEACYRAAIAHHVGLAVSAAELHALGTTEVARTDEAIAALGATLFGTPDLASTLARLRADRALYFSSSGEILAAAEAALARAKVAAPAYFVTLPSADCVLREIPAYEAPSAPVAYYRQPHYDGSKPGELCINTHTPEMRARYELEAVTWHEGIPGHHNQIALAMELEALPAFRKLDGFGHRGFVEASTAYVEGWALYTEGLAEEMGLYSSDLARLGQRTLDACRAARLVVDTGLHALGWTRARAEAYLRDHTAMTEGNLSNEVDRYLGCPGQALAYKVGQLEIRGLRAQAERALGATFRIAAFHAVVLGAGAVTLPVLGDRVARWIEAAR